MKQMMIALALLLGLATGTTALIPSAQAQSAWISTNGGGAHGGGGG